MFIRLIKSANRGFLKKLINMLMYKVCINSYISSEQDLLLKQTF